MGQQSVNVYFLPQDVDPAALASSAVIVIDLLRATTTISQAIASGAREVVPFLEIDETLAAAVKGDRSDVVLGGERHGGKIPGFDLGNSPAEYTPEAVGGRRVFITTTNGTRALDHAKRARRLLVGALVNLSAVAASVKEESRVGILCAGTGGQATREDILAAGAFVRRLSELADFSSTKNAAADDAQRQWQQVLAAAEAAGRSVIDQTVVELRDTQGGQNLLGIGLDKDLVDCAQIDRLSVVPELDVRDWRILGR